MHTPNKNPLINYVVLPNQIAYSRELLRGVLSIYKGAVYLPPHPDRKTKCFLPLNSK